MSQSSKAQQAAWGGADTGRDWGRDCLPRDEYRTLLRPSSARTCSTDKAKPQRPGSAMVRPPVAVAGGGGEGSRAARDGVAPEKARRGLGSAQRRKLRQLSSSEQHRASWQGAQANKGLATQLGHTSAGEGPGCSLPSTSSSSSCRYISIRGAYASRDDEDVQDAWDELEAKARTAERMLQQRQSRPSSAVPRGPITEEEEDAYVGKTINQTGLELAMQSCWNTSGV